MDVQSKKKRARRKAERPGEILDAAFEEFVKTGYAATRLEDVASRAGVTKGTIYFYFETKERVFDEMIRHVSRSIFPELENFVAALQGPHAARLQALIVFVYRRIAEDRVAQETLRFLISEGSRFPDLVDRHYDEFIRPVIEQCHALIESGVAAGEFRASPALNFTELILSPALLLNVWSLLFEGRRKIDIAAFIDASVDLLMNGLSLPAAPSRTEITGRR
jgi:AcrR family transcriptional regulator